MRVVQYHRRAASGDGGITNSVRQLSMAMARAGAEPVILCQDDAPPVELPGVEWRQVPHAEVGPVVLPRRVRPAIADADVVVLNSAWTTQNAAVGRSARRAGIPYVSAPRGAYDPRLLERRRLLKRVWWLLGERRLLMGSALFHVFFESEIGHATALGYHGPMLVAPNGVVVPDDVRWGRDGDHLLYLGRYDPAHKGLDLLLRAVALAGDDVPPLVMHGSDWVGGKGVLLQMVAELGIEDRVTIGGHLSGREKWEAFAAARAFVYPSRWEAFGNSTAEAAALGVPTLVTPYPLGEHLAAQGAAVMAEPDPVALAEGLRRVVAPDAAAIGDRGAECTRREFTWDAVAATWLEALERMKAGR